MFQRYTSHKDHGDMSRPVVVEPPNKRQRAAREVAGQGKEGVDEVVEGRGLEEDDEEFRRLEAVSAVQDELNALEEEEAQQVPRKNNLQTNTWYLVYCRSSCTYGRH